MVKNSIQRQLSTVVKANVVESNFQRRVRTHRLRKQPPFEDGVYVGTVLESNFLRRCLRRQCCELSTVLVSEFFKTVLT